jgi:predicted Zn-dependent protease
MNALTRLLLAAALLLSAGCAVNPVTGQQDFVLMSEDQELALGRQYHAEVMKEYREYDDPALKAYVQRIGERLARNSHRSGLVYRFTVLDSPEVNAFAVPGGYIYITRGILAYLGDEADLAAVLGHELGHVTARHTVRQHGAETAVGLLGAILAASTGVEGAGDLASVAGTALTRGYGREHELEADRLGAEYLARSGYEPGAMLDVLRVLKNQETFEQQIAKTEGREPRSYHGLFSTHPDNDQRLKEVIAASVKLKAAGAAREGRDDFLKRMDRLTFGDSEQDGVRRGNRFYHGPLDFTLTFPEGWRLENSSDHLLAYAPGGSAALFLTLEDLNKRLPPRDYLLKRLKLRNLEAESPLSPSGLQGHTGVAAGKSPFGTRTMRYAALYHHDRAFLFAGAAQDDRKLGQYDREFLGAVQSFRPLRAEERTLAKPLRLRMVTAKPGLTYSQLARNSRLGSQAEQQLRLLNGHYPQGEPQPGSSLKVVE